MHPNHQPIENPLPATADTFAETKSDSPHKLLGGNGRFVALNLAIGAAVLIIGTLAIAWGSVPMQILGGLASVVALAMLWFAWQLYVQPRLAITNTELLVYLKPNYRSPFRVPLEIVEVFFIGQGAVSGTEPGQPDGYGGAVAANVIVRLAEAAKDWHQRDVHLMLGVWDDGYITVRGLFCENIDQDVLKAMNRELMSRKRQLRDAQSS